MAPASTPPPLLTTPEEQAYFQALSDAANVLVVRTGQAGDFSPYDLRLVNDAIQASEDPFKVTEVLAGFDPQLAAVEFSFKVECGPNFDCAPPARMSAGCSGAALINYLPRLRQFPHPDAGPPEPTFAGVGRHQ